MPISTRGVLTGGLVAGLVGNVIGFLGFGLVLGPRIQSEAVEVLAAPPGRGVGGAMIATNIGVQLVLGLLLVWLYAAMRPRFGPGAKTAAYAALGVWLCGFLFRLDWWLIGMMTGPTYALASALALFQVVTAASVGGYLYRETDGS